MSRESERTSLVRRAAAFDNKTCGLVADFREREIPSVSYDRHHDEGRKVRERDTLRAFHFRYAARKSACRATDDSTQIRSFRGIRAATARNFHSILMWSPAVHIVRRWPGSITQDIRKLRKPCRSARRTQAVSRRRGSANLCAVPTRARPWQLPEDQRS